MNLGNFGVGLRVWRTKLVLVFVFLLCFVQIENSTGSLSNAWCNIKTSLGHQCEINLPPKFSYVKSEAVVSTLPPPVEPLVVSATEQIPAQNDFFVEKNINYTTNNKTVAAQTLENVDNNVAYNNLLNLLIFELIKLTTSKESQTNAISSDLFYKQVDRIYDSIGDVSDNIDGSGISASYVDTALAELDDSFTTDILTVTGNTSVVGNLAIGGELQDSTSSGGDEGMVLLSTGVGTQWVATSSLGISGGGGGTSTFLALTDTPSSFTANRLMFTNSGGTTLTDSANLVFDGTNLGLGTASPTSRLDITGTATSSAVISLRDPIGNIAMEIRAGTSTLLNTFLGVDAGRVNSSGNNNTGVGNRSLYTNATGTANTATGYRSLYTNTSGSSNSAFGTQALYLNTTGGFNTAIGRYSLYNNATGSSNTAIGSDALYSNTSGTLNTAIGRFSMNSNITGSNNTATGYQALYSNLTGTSNVANGHQALYNNTASHNVGLGLQALYSNISGADNTVIGYKAGYSVTSANNTLLGYQAGYNLTTGTNNIAIGFDIDLASSTRSNQLNIGNLIFGTGVDGTGTTLSSGNIGIGTSTPSSKLTVIGDTYIANNLSFDSTNRDSGIIFAGDNMLMHSSGKEMPDATGIIIPMYLYPSDIYNNTDYNNVIDLKKRYHNVPLYVVLNPSDGPGAVVDGNFTAAIKRLKGAGAIVLGYVPTDYTVSISVNDAKTDVDTWRTLYPETDGIFIDEMTNTASTTAQDYYTELTRYIHGKGFYPSIGNPGAGTVGEYFASSTADVIVIHETGSYPSETTLKGDYGGGYADFDYNKRAGLVYNSPSFEVASTTLLKKYLGLIYVTDDTLANPWDTVSPYLENLFELLSTENNRYFADLSIDGNLGIGTTTPSAKLTITQSSDMATGGFWLSASDNTDFRSQYMDTSGVLSFYGGDAAGTLNTATLNAAGEWTNASDVAYKENIKKLSYGLESVLALQPRSYDIKNTDNHRIGFIAQEVEQVIPEVVSGEEGKKGISYGNLVAVAIKAIQELAEKVSNFANIFRSDRIETNTLCVGNTCVTENELQELMNQSSLPPANVSPSTENQVEEEPTPDESTNEDYSDNAIKVIVPVAPPETEEQVEVQPEESSPVTL